ncbi:MAG: hypothetical protein DCC65_13555 [Planctomycetota bacterium]|nr:MAG: hypothetical protein DCC65_13555 [Planctomycetota bacterium]
MPRRPGEFCERYNTVRPYWALVPDIGGDPATPLEVFLAKLTPKLPRWQGRTRAAKKKLDRLTQAKA